jgi:hypothetical protein
MAVADAAHAFARRFRPLILATAVAVGTACVPAVASAQDIVADVLTVPFAIVAAPFVAADAAINGPYYPYPVYRHRYSRAYYAYPPASCGYDPYGRWICFPY